MRWFSVNSIIFCDLVVLVSNDVHTVVAYDVGIEQYETGRVQWAPSWSNAQRRDTISLPASLPIAKASTPPQSFSHAFTARFVGPSMNGLPRKPGCARPRCPRDHLAQADRHHCGSEWVSGIMPLFRALKSHAGSAQ